MGVSGPLVKYKVDASAEGCTGLFWRIWSTSRRFVTGPNQRNPPWPRNGAIVEGRISDVAPGYLVLRDGLALPFHDAARKYTYLHPVDLEDDTGFLPRSASAVALEQQVFDAVVLGSGPAGLTAAMYLARNARSVLLVGGPAPGGAMMLSKAVENFPSSEASAGSDIMTRLVHQAKSFGTQFYAGSARRLSVVPTAGPNSSMNLFSSDMRDGSVFRSRGVIIATGATERWLGLPGEDLLRGVSLHTCAFCDARFYEGADVCVVGGGDGALEAAGYLARIAKSVVLVHRRKSWKGSVAAARRVEHVSSIRVLRPFVVEAWKLDTAGKLAGAKLRHTGEGSLHEVSCTGAFVMIGREPQTSFLPTTVKRDGHGFVVLQQYSMTTMAGVFAAGQVADGKYQQAVTAASAGAQAAMDLGRWLDDPMDAVASGEEAVAPSLRSAAAREKAAPGNLLHERIGGSLDRDLAGAVVGMAIVAALLLFASVRWICSTLNRADCPKLS